MNTALRLAANGLWLASALPAAWRFTRARRAVGATQARVLMDIVRANADTEFGRRHTFAAIDTPAAFQQRVPLAVYADFVPAIDRIATGVTYSRPLVKLLEPTSGSAPPNSSLHGAAPARKFQTAIAA
ncbi:MAG: GH3 auxin-responsive promoter family protein [Caldilineaceae bacterium]|nr:GH3 auxin-responsive promoter family protein [Caldilineaceae bacterium]